MVSFADFNGLAVACTDDNTQPGAYVTRNNDICTIWRVVRITDTGRRTMRAERSGETVTLTLAGMQRSCMVHTLREVAPNFTYDAVADTDDRVAIDTQRTGAASATSRYENDARGLRTPKAVADRVAIAAARDHALHNDASCCGTAPDGSPIVASIVVAGGIVAYLYAIPGTSSYDRITTALHVMADDLRSCVSAFLPDGEIVTAAPYAPDDATPDDRPQGMTIAEYHHGIGEDVAGNVLHAAHTLQRLAGVSFLGMRSIPADDRRVEIAGAVQLAVSGIDADAQEWPDVMPQGGMLDSLCASAWHVCGMGIDSYYGKLIPADRVQREYLVVADRAADDARRHRMVAALEAETAQDMADRYSVSHTQGCDAYARYVERRDEAILRAITSHGIADTLRAGATMLRAYC